MPVKERVFARRGVFVGLLHTQGVFSVELGGPRVSSWHQTYPTEHDCARSEYILRTDDIWALGDSIMSYVHSVDPSLPRYSAPVGWKLVPKVLTKDMLDIIRSQHNDPNTAAKHVYETSVLWELLVKSIPTTFTQVAQNKFNENVTELLLQAAATIAAMISLLERAPKRIAPSDRMFDQMMVDYVQTLNRLRDALNGQTTDEA